MHSSTIRRALNRLIAPRFSITFLHYRIINSICESVEDNSDSFNFTCTDILDSIAPLRTKRSKPLSEPCLNEYTHTLRHKCSRAERRWENNRSYVSLQVFKDGISVYQGTVNTINTNFIVLVSTNNRYFLMFLIILLVHVIIWCCTFTKYV